MFQNKVIFLISMMLLTILLASTCYCVVLNGNEKTDSLTKFNNDNSNNMGASNNFVNRNNNLIKRDSILNHDFFKDFNLLDWKHKINTKFNNNNSNFNINDFKLNFNFDYDAYYNNDTYDNYTVIIYANETQSIRELVNIAENKPVNNVVIILTNNVHDIGSNESIVINKNLTIRGANNSRVLLKGDSNKGVFKVSNNITLFLKNIEIDNLNVFSYDSGIIENRGNLLLNNCTFNNNEAGKGYVIYNLKDSNSIISNCDFNNNRMSDGSVLFNKLSDNIVVYKSTFKNNSNPGKGSAICNDKSESLTINESIFDSNTAGRGGAIYSELFTGILSSTANNFTNNYAYSEGGAIYNENGGGFAIQSNNFGKNEAIKEGGAIYNKNCDGFTIESSVFNNNTGDRGGAFYTTSAAAIIDHSRFTFNHAKAGGAIFNQDGKKYSYAYNNCIFGANGDNRDNTYGGAITLINANFQFSKSNFLDNNANKGAGIYIKGEGSELTLIDTGFARNKLNSSSNLNSRGGAIYGDNGTKIDLTRSKFIGNSANYGGSIFSSSDLDGNNCDFKNNSALSNGGSIFSLGSLSMSNSLFENNNGSSGGAIYKSHIVDGLNINNSTFKNNKANNDGGAIYNDLSKYAVIDNSNFENNNAKNGGVLYDTGSYFNISNSNFNHDDPNNHMLWIEAKYIYLTDLYINNHQINQIKNNPNIFAYDYYQEYIYLRYSSYLTLNDIPPTTINNSVNITGNLASKVMGIENKTINISITLPNGTIEKFNTTTNSTGDYNYLYIPLISGKYNVTTNFMWDNYYNPSNCSNEFNVGKVNTNITLNNISPTNINNPINITGNLTNNNMGIANKTININIRLPNGTIEKFNTTTNITGDYNYSYTPLINGKYNVTANFLGNEKYNASTSSNTLIVSNIHFMNVTATNPNDTVNITGSLVDDNGLGVGGVNVNCNNVTTSTNPDGSFSIIDNSHHISPGDKTINCVNNVKDSVYVPPTVTYYNYTLNHHMYLIRVNYLFAESNTTEVSFNYTFNTTECTRIYGGAYDYVEGNVSSNYDFNTGLIQMNFNVPVNKLGEARIMFYI
jgi:hypothetical protein